MPIHTGWGRELAILAGLALCSCGGSNDTTEKSPVQGSDAQAAATDSRATVKEEAGIAGADAGGMDARVPAVDAKVAQTDARVATVEDAQVATVDARVAATDARAPVTDAQIDNASDYAEKLPENADVVPFKTLHFNSHWIAGGESAAAITASADFYESVFGMQETRRFGFDILDDIGIALNFGATPEQAKTQPGPDFGVAKSVANPPDDDFIRIAIHPNDIDAAVKLVGDNGGSMASNKPAGASTDAVFFRDPGGNLIEISPSPSYLAKSPITQVQWRIPATKAKEVARFYQAVLGLYEISRSGPKDAPNITLKFGLSAKEAAKSTNPARLTIVSVAAQPPLRMGTNASQIAFGMTDAEEQKAVLDRATKNGGETVLDIIEIPISTNPVVYSTFARFSDPAGNVIELVYSDKMKLPPSR